MGFFDGLMVEPPPRETQGGSLRVVRALVKRALKSQGRIKPKPTTGEKRRGHSSNANRHKIAR